MSERWGALWHPYALSDDEHFVCDNCIQSMPLYAKTYGPQPEGAQTP